MIHKCNVKKIYIAIFFTFIFEKNLHNLKNLKMIKKNRENWRIILARNIESERDRLSLNQEELAKRLGLNSYATVSVWENARGLPKMEIFEKLCTEFNRTPTEMMYEDLSLKPPPDDGLPKESQVKEMDVGGASKASESPPQKGEKEEIQEMRKQMLEMMMKLEEMTQ